ncbi:phosphopentomutase [Shimia sp.]|uniref:phosphopentomutase n=1 Tax=Shimia sp. TaxID=1954381 RepID=UPI003B8BC997
MARVFLVVMDSVGCGGAVDANVFFNEDLPDTGSNTLAHIAQACAEGRAQDGRSGPLKVPNLDALGLGAATRMASGDETPGLDATPVGFWGAANEHSPGKDTPSGHWELAGLPVPWDWGYFPKTTPCFPEDLVAKASALAGTQGILGNCHSSGTVIINDLGAEHVKTGMPICYTSADSVFQIAAHEEHFGLERLIDLCRDLAPTLHAMKIGRVIARPFVGDAENGFERTTNRRDFAIAPPAPLLTNWVQEAGGAVLGVGKIGDILTMAGIDSCTKGSDAKLMVDLNGLAETAPDGSLTFANFVEFDSLYGHRRDISGYARALEWFDREIGAFMGKLREDDLLILTADHGNDPSWPGTDHTRERVPVLCAGVGAGEAGLIDFIDVAATAATHLGLTPPRGRNFL